MTKDFGVLKLTSVYDASSITLALIYAVSSTEVWIKTGIPYNTKIKTLADLLKNADANTFYNKPNGGTADQHLTKDVLSAFNPPALVPGTLFSVNYSNATTYQYSIAPTSGAINLSVNTSLSKGSPMGVAVTPDHKFAYVVSSNHYLYPYSIDEGTGTLRDLPQGATTIGTTSRSVAVHQSGNWLYVANGADNNIGQYSIAKDGSLTAMKNPTVPTGTSPAELALSPNGKYAYVTDCGSNQISMYAIDSLSGQLSPLNPPAAVTGGSCAWGMVIHPSGNFAYVAVTSGLIAQYSINSKTGVLSALTPATIVETTFPTDLYAEPSGRYVYVVNRDSNNISQYSVNQSTGVLTALSTKTAASGKYPFSITGDQSGTYVYVANLTDETISTYVINPLNGLLALVTTSAKKANFGLFKLFDF